MHGWVGKILRVDLTSGKISTSALDPALARDYIGARGLGTKFIYDEVDPKVDPLSPANKLIFASGPMTGTFAPSAGRYDVVTKGPLTDTIAASNSGGAWGPELKFAGYDLLIVEGKAAKPVYLWIQDDKVEIRDATNLWGKEVPETTDLLYAETAEDAKVACIGPAGEHLSQIAAIMNDRHRAAGRTGVGAVMGSKNLKAIAVRGTGSVTVADNKAFLAAVSRASTMLKEHPVSGTGLRVYGTDVLVNVLNSIGGLPTGNFQDGHFPTADKVGGETLTATVLQRVKGCFSCIISCGRVTKVTNPKYQGEGEGPEYETAWGFGPDCLIDDLEAITKANYYCNELGIDTISMASTIACAMEMFQKGIIGLKDTEGLALTFGNAEAMVEAVRLTGLSQGFGKKLQLGSWRLASLYGHPELSMTVKKQEMPAYDPRAVQGIGLHYATSNRGGCHVRGYTVSPEVLGVPFKVDKDTTVGKPALVALFQNLTAAIDSSGACLFTSFGIGAAEYGELMTALTGVAYSADDFVKAGERIYNLERLFNLGSGLTAKDDTLPARLLNEPLTTGASKGLVSHVPEMLPEYYELRGWSADGVPTAEKLGELALSG
jgi:aldehyde:ferredoxin oxidoreductase